MIKLDYEVIYNLALINRLKNIAIFVYILKKYKYLSVDSFIYSLIEVYAFNRLYELC